MSKTLFAWCAMHYDHVFAEPSQETVCPTSCWEKETHLARYLVAQGSYVVVAT